MCISSASSSMCSRISMLFFFMLLRCYRMSTDGQTFLNFVEGKGPTMPNTTAEIIQLGTKNSIISRIIYVVMGSCPLWVTWPVSVWCWCLEWIFYANICRLLPAWIYCIWSLPQVLEKKTLVHDLSTFIHRNMVDKINFDPCIEYQVFLTCNSYRLT